MTAAANRSKTGPTSPWDNLLPAIEGEKCQQLQLVDRLRVLYEYGDMVLRGEKLSPDCATALGNALKAIALGKNAEVALLGQRVKQGGKRLQTMLRQKYAIKWVSAATDKNSEDSLSLDEAFEQAGKLFGYSKHTVRKYWNSAETDRSKYFQIP